MTRRAAWPCCRCRLAVVRSWFTPFRSNHVQPVAGDMFSSCATLCSGPGSQKLVHYFRILMRQITWYPSPSIWRRKSKLRFGFRVFDSCLLNGSAGVADCHVPSTRRSFQPHFHARPGHVLCFSLFAQLKVRAIEYGPEVVMCVTLIYGTYTSHKKGFAQLHKDHRD